MTPRPRTHLKDHNSFLYQDVPSPLPSNGMLPTHEAWGWQTNGTFQRTFQEENARLKAENDRRQNKIQMLEEGREEFWDVVVSPLILFWYFCLFSAVDMKEISLFLLSISYILSSFCFGHGNCLYILRWRPDWTWKVVRWSVQLRIL